MQGFARMSDNTQKPPKSLTPEELVRYELAGLMIPGIVHNINTPLQIISMQVELFKMQIEKMAYSNIRNNADMDTFKDKALERLEKIETAAENINKILENVTFRYADEIGDKKPVTVNELLSEEIAYFNSDLFFKHKVKVSEFSNGTAHPIKTQIRHMRDTFSFILSLCVAQLKNFEDNTELIIQKKFTSDLLEIKFEITHPFPASFHEITEADSELKAYHFSNDINWPRLMLLHACRSARLAGGAVTLEESSVIFRHSISPKDES